MAFMDRRRDGVEASAAGVLSRTIAFAVLGAAGIVAVLYPFFISLYHNPIKQMPIPHDSRLNFFLNPSAE